MDERKLSLRSLLVGTSFVTQATLLLLAGFLCYYAVRSVLWHHGLQQMDWRLLGSSSFKPASEVSAKEFQEFVNRPVELGKRWREAVPQISGGVYRVQLYDLQGHLLARSHSDLLLAPPSPDQFQRSRIAGGRPAREPYVAEERQILVIPVTVEGQLAGYLQMSNNWWPSHSVLNWLLSSLWIGVFCIVAVTGSVNLALVRLLARPLERLAACSRQVGAGELQIRARLKTRCSEIAQVGSTFDQMLERLQGVIEAQKGFVADVSHELRTPLTALAGQLHIALACLPNDCDPRLSRAVQKAEHEYQRIVDLVEDLLSLVKAENASLPMEPVSLKDLVAGLVEQNENIHVEHSEPLWMLGNLPALQRALGNLVQNALTYSGAPPTLRLTREGDWARLDVIDQGPGIKPEDLEKLGQRFFRADPSRSRKSGGTGLGLSIVKATAEQHGGRLEITSQVGQGTIASLLLPITID